MAKKKNSTDYFPKRVVDVSDEESEEAVLKYLEGTEIEEGEAGGYYFKQGRQIKDIVMEQIKKLSDLSVQELKEGYWKTKPVKVGESVTLIEVYVPDLREAFCNGVDFLYDLILPTIEEEQDKVLKKFKNESDKNLDKLFTKYKESGEDPDNWVDDKLTEKKKLFAQINIHLDKIDYFNSSEDEFQG